MQQSHTPSPLNVSLDVLADGRLACALADLRDVCSREAVRELYEGIVVDVGRDWRLAQHRLEDLEARRLVRQRDVHLARR
eukprot:142208-Chlamydomonas_euryale.AAC.2